MSFVHMAQCVRLVGIFPQKVGMDRPDGFALGCTCCPTRRRIAPANLNVTGSQVDPKCSKRQCILEVLVSVDSFDSGTLMVYWNHAA